jgi:molybdate transport system substrate-binding protein
VEIAKREKLVLSEAEKIVAYFVPAINVPAGNLARPGLRVGIARPDSVCVGLYGVEVLERAGLADRVRPNVVTHAESCEKTAQLVALGTVDAVLGWELGERRLSVLAQATGRCALDGIELSSSSPLSHQYLRQQYLR